MLACTTENSAEGKIDLETHYPSILLVQDVEGQYIQLCMVPYILANEFVNVEFTLQADLRQDYTIVYAIPSFIKVICY